MEYLNYLKCLFLLVINLACLTLWLSYLPLKQYCWYRLFLFYESNLRIVLFMMKFYLMSFELKLIIKCNFAWIIHFFSTIVNIIALKRLLHWLMFFLLHHDAWFLIYLFLLLISLKSAKRYYLLKELLWIFIHELSIVKFIYLHVCFEFILFLLQFYFFLCR